MRLLTVDCRKDSRDASSVTRRPGSRCSSHSAHSWAPLTPTALCTVPKWTFAARKTSRNLPSTPRAKSILSAREEVLRVADGGVRLLVGLFIYVCGIFRLITDRLKNREFSTRSSLQCPMVGSCIGHEDATIARAFSRRD